MPVRRNRKQTDAVDLLTLQHAAIRELFVNHQRLSRAPEVTDNARRVDIDRLCVRLATHGQIETELFYPVVRDVSWDLATLHEATADHIIIEELMEALAVMRPRELAFQATINILEEYVVLHFREEEKRIFPALQAASVNLVELGALLQARHDALLERHFDQPAARIEPPAPGAFENRP